MAQTRLGSSQAASRRVAIVKPKNDIYVSLLAIALVAVLIGLVLMLMEFNEYGRTITPNVSLHMPSVASPEFVASILPERAVAALA